MFFPRMSEPIQLAGYEILEKIGEGGMSTVWKGRQISLDRLVAIKILSAENLPDSEARQRFHHEAKAAARLSHPGIVQVFDAGVANGLPYIVMEYVDGRPLGDLLAAGGKLPEEKALRIVEAVAHALGYAWDKDCIIHCDIKPDNLLIADDGSVKVADLGLARFIGLHRRSAQGDAIVGTPNYTAPEQAEGVPDLDCRADIYSLGATLYHMTTGVLPFAGSPGSSAMDRHIHDFLADPMEVEPTLSSNLAWLVEKMMVKDRAFRPPYWSTVLEDVAEVLKRHPPKEPLPETGQSTVSRSERREETTEASATRTMRIPIKVPAMRKRMVVSQDAREMGSKLARREKSSGLGLALFQFLALSIVAAALYLFFFMGVAERIRPRPSEAPLTLTAPLHMAVSAGNEQAPPKEKVSPAIAPERAASAQSIAWQNADFLRGARAFNEAIELYKNYQATRTDPAVLGRVEALAREATKAFEACRDLAPADVDMNGHIRNAYHLLEDVRQSTLFDNPAISKENDTELDEPRPPLTPEPAPVLSADEQLANASGLMLSPQWNNKPSAPGPVWEELKALLHPYAQSAPVTDPQMELQLVGQIVYRMPAIEAARALGTQLGVKRPLIAAGFPERSFNYYVLRGDFGDGFNLAAVVVDGGDRVAALQLSRESLAPPLLNKTAYRDEWQVLDFVQGKGKPAGAWRIAHRVQTRDQIVVLESEMADLDPAGSGQAVARAALYLPQPMVNLILARLETAN